MKVLLMSKQYMELNKTDIEKIRVMRTEET